MLLEKNSSINEYFTESESITEKDSKIDKRETTKGELVEIYSNQKLKEKLFLLKDNLNFTFFGSGSLNVIFGNVEIMGYEILSEKNKDDFEFDLHKNFFLFNCINSGVYLNEKNIISVKENYQKIFQQKECLVLKESKLEINEGEKFKKVQFSLLNFEKYINTNMSLIYFKNISEDFKILNLNESFSLKQQIKYYNKSESIFQFTKENSIIFEENKKIIESLEIIDTKKFSKNLDLSLNTIKKNKKFNIFGKKNSGKSTFLIYFINSFLSKLNKYYSENCKLFLLDCDSGQPLITSPYCVSLLEIKKPLFMNFSRKNIFSNLEFKRKFQFHLKSNSFNFSKNFINEIHENINPNNINIEQVENYDSDNLSIIEEKNKIINILNEEKSDKSIELIRSNFVDDNSPANNFDVYLNSIKNLYNIFNTINNFSIERIKNEVKYQTNYNRRNGFNDNNYIKENLKNFLIINTSGYTSGIGNIINSSINDLVDPDYIYFIKNLKAGRNEKGEEFEKLILNNQICYNNSIITKKYKMEEDEQKRIIFNYKKLEKTTNLIENSFKLKDCENLNKKNFNKIYRIISDLIGDYNFDLIEEYKNKNRSKDVKNLDSLKNIINFYDFFLEKNFCKEFLIEISFDDLVFSFDFSLFEPMNEFDVLMGLNGKMCAILSNEKNTPFSVQNHLLSENNNKYYNNLSVIDSNTLNEKIFKCYCFVYNIDIINRKVILLSKQLKDETYIFKNVKYNKNQNKSFKMDEENLKRENENLLYNKKDLILLRNTNLDKILYDSVFLKDPLLEKKNYLNNGIINYNSSYLEKLFIRKKFDFKRILHQEKDSEKNIEQNQDPSLKNFNDLLYITRNKFNLI